jgi:hypothetical protein
LAQGAPAPQNSDGTAAAPVILALFKAAFGAFVEFMIKRFSANFLGVFR